jgi:pimeloyl-ACP methyl ester carboxylesterase
MQRQDITVDGVRWSVLASGATDAAPVLLLHGTFWSRVWQPVLPALGSRLRCLALDFPGFGHSAGEMSVDRADVPALADQVLRAADVLGLETFDVAAHDIGGGVAQHLAVHAGRRVRRMVLMNSVMFDSWPVPAVERFRDPQVRADTSVGDLVEARRASMAKAVARPLSKAEVENYVSVWQEPQRARSWMAMAAAADPAFTLDLVPGLVQAKVPTRLVWGRDDEFQKLSYARKYVDTVPVADLVEVPGRHIPTEDSPELSRVPSSST